MEPIEFDESVDYLAITRDVVRTSVQQQWNIVFTSEQEVIDFYRIPYWHYETAVESAVELDLEAELSEKLRVGFIEIKVISKTPVKVPTDAWLKTNYFPIGEIYLDPGKVYDCPKHGDEAVEWLYGIDSVFITAETLRDLVRNGQITISEK